MRDPRERCNTIPVHVPTLAVAFVKRFTGGLRGVPTLALLTGVEGGGRGGLRHKKRKNKEKVRQQKESFRTEKAFCTIKLFDRERYCLGPHVQNWKKKRQKHRS